MLFIFVKMYIPFQTTLHLCNYEILRRLMTKVKLLMLGFELRISGDGCDSITNYTADTVFAIYLPHFQFLPPIQIKFCYHG